jgi:hypothetical protein
MWQRLCITGHDGGEAVSGSHRLAAPCPSHTEFARFLDIAGRSVREIEDRLIEAVDTELLTKDQAAPGFNLAKRTSVAIARLAKYLREKRTGHRAQGMGHRA